MGWQETELGELNAGIIRDAVDALSYLARYHRLEVRHLERVPDGPALLVGNHSAGLSIIDGLFLIEYYRQRGFDQPVFILAHDLVFHLEGLRRWMGAIGILRAGPNKAREVLRAGHKLLVFPGGDREALRPFRQRRRVDLAGRTGWARLAIEEQVPVVPVVSAGAHEALLVLTQGRALARLLGLQRWFRIDSFPAMLCLPWGLLVGPTCALPYLPLPTKVTVEIGAPIAPLTVSDATDDRKRVIAELYARMEEAMQATAHRLYDERRWPVIG